MFKLVLSLVAPTGIASASFAQQPSSNIKRWMLQKLDVPDTH